MSAAPPPPGRIGRLLAHPRLPVAAVAVAIVLSLPSLVIGFYADDLAMVARLEHVISPVPPPWDLYRFATGDPEELWALMRAGPGPWWCDPALKLHFFRPLSSVLLVLDHALFGRRAALWHVHTILWYGALVAALGLLYRRALPRASAVAGLALLLFAVDDAHYQPAGWISARHMTVAAVPAVLGLVAHLRARQDRWRPGLWLGPLGVAVGLLGSEAALGAIAYWLAYDLLGPAPEGERGLGPRALAAAPILALGAAYAAFYKIGGYGAAHNGFYFDPASEPVAFAGRLLVRAPALVGDFLAGLPSDLTSVAPIAAFAAVGVASAAVVALLYRSLSPLIPEDERRALRWLVPGSLLALVLASGGFVGNRLLLLPGVGGFPLIAALLVHGAGRGRALLARAAWAWLGLVHVIASPLLLVVSFLVTAGFVRKTNEAVLAAPLDAPPPRSAVLLAASDPAAGFYAAALLALERPGAARTWHILSMAHHTHRVTRTGPSTLAITTDTGNLFEGGFVPVFRSVKEPVHVGDRVALKGITVTVTAVDGPAPKVIEVLFDRPFDDPELVLLAWKDGRLQRVAPPKEGETLEIPWSPGPLGLF